ncbi:MAG: exodeoxyribonuclease VII small subunit [Ignavibacteriae bacterium]|nr:exodeoxyribonuclease VII small subunit [Ignavibacteriota bacterium]
MTKVRKKEKNFEESLLRLQEISELLESEEVSLEDSIKIYEEGITLSKYCYSILEKAELKVEELNIDLQNDLK